MTHKLLNTIKSILANEYLPIMSASIHDDLPLTSKTARLIDEVDFGRLNETLIRVGHTLSEREKTFDREQFMTGLIVWEYILDAIDEGRGDQSGASELAVKLSSWYDLHGAYECRERAINMGVKFQAAWDKFLEPYDDEEDQPLHNLSYDFEIVPFLIGKVADELVNASDSDLDAVKLETIAEGFTDLVALATGA